MPRPPETDIDKSRVTVILKAMSNLRRMQILSEFIRWHRKISF